MAKIQSKYEDKFNPYVRTAVNGKVVQVTKKELEQNPRKWINTSLGHWYEDYDKLKKDILSRTAKPKAEKLDMSTARTRGDIFDEEKRLANNPRSLYMNKTLAKQAAKRARLEKLAQAKLKTKQTAKTKASTKTTSAAKKAAAEKLAEKDK